MPISEKRSATDGVMVPFKKPRMDLIPGISDGQEEYTVSNYSNINICFSNCNLFCF